jgi:dinuclear metal center YbgI/SA1388 family protein
MTARVSDVMAAAESLWPAAWAEPWDTVGLAVGDPDAEVSTILAALDATDAVVDQAIGIGAQFLFTHHPLLLRGVTSVAADTLKGGAVTRLIRAGIAQFNAHTNADSAPGGVTDVLCDAIGLGQRTPLVPQNVPGVGIGRVGTLATACTVEELARRLAASVPATATGIRIAGDPTARIERVAVLGGAGDSEFDAVRRARAQVYITSDLRHHPATEAIDTGHRTGAGPQLIDIAHFAAESPWITTAAHQLTSVLAQAGHRVRLAVSHVNTDPWTMRIAQAGAPAAESNTNTERGSITWL